MKWPAGMSTFTIGGGCALPRRLVVSVISINICAERNKGNFYFITMEIGKGYPGGNFFGKV